MREGPSRAPLPTLASVATNILSSEQIEGYWRDGYLMLADALDAQQVTSLNSVFQGWCDESAKHTEHYGDTLAGRPRFDLEPGHSATAPALRRVSSPIEVSDDYLAAMRDNRGLDAVAQLIGPNIEFNNAKINSKQPGAATEVKYHQDFLFQPHSNEDLIAVLFFLDDVTLENGPLKVVPGSHTGPMFDHWHDGVFTGAVDAATAAQAEEQAIPCVGPAGAACLMHTRLVHGSAPNLSTHPRTLFIAEYRAEDSRPLGEAHIPSRFEGEVVRGERTGRIRSTAFEMIEPETPEGPSFFDQQAAAQNPSARGDGLQ